MLDSLVAQRFHAGDLEALGEIVKKFQKPLFGLGMKLFGRPEAAGDFCQDAFLKVYEKRRHFDPNRAFDPWFYKVALNVGRQQMRKKREFLVLDQLPEAAGEDRADSALIQQEERLQVRKAMEKIPRVYRETLGLRFESGLSLAEISQTLGISLGTVKSRLSRGLLAFEKAYHRTGGEVA